MRKFHNSLLSLHDIKRLNIWYNMIFFFSFTHFFHFLQPYFLFYFNNVIEQGVDNVDRKNVLIVRMLFGERGVVLEG
ncbi:hypothetical protein CRM71_04015 [Prevotella jejuni]|uniref:Uncharacterized protein n=1 Tax=Prevotella jejuni TaxID=1177574 RepID=A0A2K9H7I4_9BACT|nr:hypothetical protein CRM71_04015 [Prevotella jejuni]SNR89081.1 hypothetical protein SAMN06265364_11750 [Prevotella jejuni]